MLSSTELPVTLHADQEHEGLRTAVVFGLFFLMAAFFSSLNFFIDRSASETLISYAAPLSCIGSIVFSLGIMWGVERYLKTVWHSGNNITITEDSVLVRRSDDSEQLFDLRQGQNSLSWIFKLEHMQRGGRERRVSKKWLCAAHQLLQGEHRCIVYTYAAPKEAEKWRQESDIFRELNPKDVYKKSMKSRFTGPSRPQIPGDVLRTEDGRYWLAERNRWKDGMELTPRDFAIFISHTQLMNKKERAVEQK